MASDFPYRNIFNAIMFSERWSVHVEQARAGFVSGATTWVVRTEKVLEITGLKNGARLLEDEAYREEQESLSLQASAA